MKHGQEDHFWVLFGYHDECLPMPGCASTSYQDFEPMQGERTQTNGDYQGLLGASGCLLGPLC